MVSDDYRVAFSVLLWRYPPPDLKGASDATTDTADPVPVDENKPDRAVLILDQETATGNRSRI